MGQFLVQLGFAPSGRYWVADDLDLAVEVPAEELMIGGSPGSWDHVSEIDVEGVGAALVIGLEDLLVDRLLAAKHWGDEAALRWARVLMRVWGPGRGSSEYPLDRGYLDGLARREQVDELMQQLWHEEAEPS